ncbi:MAG TPA: DUF6221 family protein [Acidimicrobiales bacterium]|nr:DUF6221 family protein [Acidimicrobiales bacterium]
MTTATLTLAEFLSARYAEDEAQIREAQELGYSFTISPAQMLADYKAKRLIVELHESWPVLVETEPTFESGGDDPNQITMRMSQRMAWLTQCEYVERYGAEPPTAPTLRALALPYANHPDYREEWRP